MVNETSDKTPTEWTSTLESMGKAGPGKVARRIAALLRERGWNVPKLAEKADVPKSTLYSILDGTAEEPNSDTLAKIAKGFGVTETELHGTRIVDIEGIIKSFEKSGEVSRLNPPLRDVDRDRLRNEGRATFSKKAGDPMDVRRLVIFFRRLYREEDYSD